MFTPFDIDELIQREMFLVLKELQTKHVRRGQGRMKHARAHDAPRTEEEVVPEGDHWHADDSACEMETVLEEDGTHASPEEEVAPDGDHRQAEGSACEMETVQDEDGRHASPEEEVAPEGDHRHADRSACEMDSEQEEDGRRASTEEDQGTSSLSHRPLSQLSAAENDEGAVESDSYATPHVEEECGDAETYSIPDGPLTEQSASESEHVVQGDCYGTEHVEEKGPDSDDPPPIEPTAIDVVMKRDDNDTRHRVNGSSSARDVAVDGARSNGDFLTLLHAEPTTISFNPINIQFEMGCRRKKPKPNEVTMDLCRSVLLETFDGLEDNSFQTFVTGEMGPLLVSKDRLLIKEQIGTDNNCLFACMADWLRFDVNHAIHVTSLSDHYREWHDRHREECVNKRLKERNNADPGMVLDKSLFVRNFVKEYICDHAREMIAVLGESLGGVYSDEESLRTYASRGMNTNMEGGIEDIIAFSIMCNTPVLVWQQYNDGFLEMTMDSSVQLKMAHELLRGFTVDVRNEWKSVVHLLYNQRHEDTHGHYETVVIFDQRQ